MSSNLRIQRICQHCGDEFTAKTTTTKYCSHKCNSRAYKAKKRAAKVQKSNKETETKHIQPFKQLEAKPYLSIEETTKLLGISKRTIYRMIKKGVLIVGKFGSRTIIRRSDLEKLFEQNVTYEKPQPKEYKISECYFMGQVQEMFNISEKALFDVIKRNSVPKIQKGKFAYVPKEIIEPLLK